MAKILDDGEYIALLDKLDISSFKELLSQQFSSDTVLDEAVEFPILEPKVYNGNFPVINTNFLGNSDLPNDKLELETPFQIFKYFFTNYLMDRICSETYKYGVQKN
ncbi:hypothetical protein ACI65C_009706 [Semiaphis heraclei]